MKDCPDDNVFSVSLLDEFRVNSMVEDEVVESECKKWRVHRYASSYMVLTDKKNRQGKYSAEFDKSEHVLRYLKNL